MDLKMGGDGALVTKGRKWIIMTIRISGSKKGRRLNENIFSFIDTL